MIIINILFISLYIIKKYKVLNNGNYNKARKLINIVDIISNIDEYAFITKNSNIIFHNTLYEDILNVSKIINGHHVFVCISNKQIFTRGLPMYGGNKSFFFKLY